MTESFAGLHELTLEGDAGTAAELDAWIAGYLSDAGVRPGYAGADSWTLESSPDEVRRLVQIRFSGHTPDDEELSESQLRAELASLFGESVRVQSRWLTNAAPVISRPEDDRCCANCDAPLTGQYCGECGQRASRRLIRFQDLVREAFGDLFEFDSRLWRTLIPLLIRPGLLTLDYLQGRRVRYMPPFRMYLVLSLLFFLVAFFNPRERMPIFFEAESTAAPSASSELNLDLDGSSGAEACEFADYDSSTMPAWLARRLTKDRLMAACTDIVTEDERGLASMLDRMVENIPAGLFVLLPLMAAILMLIHPLSGRYYVEHLLFVVHFHSFIFLLLTIYAGVARATEAWSAAPGNLAMLVTTIYLPVYLYKALRRVYESGHLLTALRFGFLSISYFIGLGLIVAFAALTAAFSV